MQQWPHLSRHLRRLMMSCVCAVLESGSECVIGFNLFSWMGYGVCVIDPDKSTSIISRYVNHDADHNYAE